MKRKQTFLSIFSFLLLIWQAVFLLVYPVYAASSPWTQTDWSGGSGSSTTNQYSSVSSTDATTTAGQVALTNTEELSNTSFDTNLSGWNMGSSPDSVSGLKLWLKADAITGLSDGNAVSSWSDSSGNSNNASQSTTASQPLYKTNIVNGLPVVRFDGSNDSIKTSAFQITTTGNATLFWVYLPANNFGVAYGAARFVNATVGTSNRFYFGSGTTATPGKLHGNWGNGFKTGTTNIDTSNFSFVTAQRTGETSGNAKTWINGTADINTTWSNAVATLGSASVIVGGDSNGFMQGDMAEVIIFNSALSTSDQQAVEAYLQGKYGISAGYATLTRDTTTTYNSSAGSAKVVTGSSVQNLTQTVNVGDTNTYNLSAYAYTTGAEVTSSDAQLFANGSTVTTTYTSVGGGWYQLTGTVSGTASSVQYGVQAKANKTVYVDSVSLNSYAASGTLTSNIFDSGQSSDWGTLTYTATTPANTTATVKIRTSNDSAMSGATDFSSCDAISSGADISSNSCVTDNHRYVQYLLTLSTTNQSSTPTFSDFSLAFTANAPSSLSGSAAGSSSITWSWTDNAGNETGFIVQDTSGTTKCTVSSASSGTGSTASCTETGLSPNTSYTRRVVASYSGGNSDASSNASAITLSTAPASSNITSSPAASGWTNNSSFTFTNSIGFGAGGVEYFRYAWDTSSSHSWTGSESQWTSSTLTTTATSDSNSWYLHLKGYNSADTENGTVDLGPFYYDNTSPNSFDLDSPADSSYASSERPIFKWKAASTGDATSGLSRYKLAIDNGDSGDFTIDNIPVSRTTDYDTSKYLVHYENFSDSDSTNNYISVYTKSSISWGTGENDGKLKEGKRSWKIVAVDNAGNTKDASRTIYADFNPPALNSLQVDSAGEKDNYRIVTETKPTITGSVSDNIAPDKIEFSLYKEHMFFGIVVSQTLDLTETYSLNNTQNNTEISFTFSPSKDLDYGKYQLTATAIDKAGNRSAQKTLNLQILTKDKAQLLLAGETTEKIKAELEKTRISLSELEKKAKLRRGKETAELEKLTREIKQALNSAGSQSLAMFNIITQNAAYGAQSIYNNTAKNLAQLSTGISDTVSTVSGTASDLSNSINNQLASTQKKLVNLSQSAPGNVKAAFAAVKTGFNPISDFFGQADRSLVLTLQQTRSQITETQNHTRQNAANLVSSSISLLQEGKIAVISSANTINQTLDKSENNIRQQIRNTNKETSQKLANAQQAVGTTWRSLKRPVDQADDFAARVKVGADTFMAIVFDPNPTKISNVTIEEIGKDYAIISWQTNHFAWGKVNYGEDLSYGKEASLDKREKYHQAKLVDLKPGKRYFFEVMSQNKNYAYDAYYSFEVSNQ